MVTSRRAWVFERRGARGRMRTVFSLANPAGRATGGSRDRPAPGEPLADRAVLGWAASLGEHMRLAHSAGRYDTLELIASRPLATTVERAARDHVDRVFETTIEGDDERAVRRAAGRLARGGDPQHN